jgi:hypothetical protein
MKVMATVYDGVGTCIQKWTFEYDSNEDRRQFAKRAHAALLRGYEVQTVRIDNLDTAQTVGSEQGEIAEKWVRACLGVLIVVIVAVMLFIVGQWLRFLP